MGIDNFNTIDLGLMEKEYNNFYAPSFEVKFGDESSISLGMEITNISVINSLEGADQFTFNVGNSFDIIKRDFNWVDNYLAPGKEVEIRMGYCDKLEPLIFGKISSIKVNFPAGKLPQLTVTGLDIMGDMMKGKKSVCWSDVKDSEIVSSIISKYKISEVYIDETKIKRRKVNQENKSDFQFINELAIRNNYEFFVFEKTLYFREKAKKRVPAVILEWGVNLSSFSPVINMVGQVSKVRGKYWDNKAKKALEVEVDRVDEIGIGGEKFSTELVKEYYGEDVVEQLNFCGESHEEALLSAKTMLNRKSANFLTGEGETIGIPALRAGRFVKLTGLGKKFSKTYYIYSTTHTINNTGYRTYFSVRSNKI